MARLGGELGAPSPALRAIVVVPARDEAELIGECIAALRAQRGIEPSEWELLLVLDGCRDATRERALAAGAGLRIEIVELPGLGAGAARAAGMDRACARLERASRPRGLIATTDADSRVAPDWLARQLEAIEAGSEAVGGSITLDPADSALLAPQTLAARERDLARRRAALGASGRIEHPHFAGASIGLTAAAYRRAGGIEPLPALEDEGLARRLEAAGVAIDRLERVRVSTSGRTAGRAPRGLARDLALAEWVGRQSRRELHGAERLAELKQRTVSVIIPAREVAETVGEIVAAIAPHRESGLIDELVVIDADSADGTAAIAERAGATVHQENELLAEFGPCRGKGDAMWRGASVASGELLVFLDSDTADFDQRLLLGLLSAAFSDPAPSLVKGAFERPFRAADQLLAGEGGRVTELVARPLLALHFPELAGFRQPLAGEIAIDRELFRRLRVPVSYGVEIAMLIDALSLVGIDALAEIELGTRQNRHQPLRSLGTMAYEVIYATLSRAEPAAVPAAGPLVVPLADGALAKGSPAVEERPALATLAPASPRGDAALA